MDHRPYFPVLAQQIVAMAAPAIGTASITIHSLDFRCSCREGRERGLQLCHCLRDGEHVAGRFRGFLVGCKTFPVVDQKACLLKNTARLLRGQAVAANLCDYRSRQHQSGAS